MFYILRSSTVLLLFVLFASAFVRAQDEVIVAPMPVLVDDRTKRSDKEKEGSIIRGRAFYEDTGKPVRRGWIGFVKIRELVEKTDDKGSVQRMVMIGGSSFSAESYVLTNDEGEFAIIGVKAGIYQPSVKVRGVLNPGYGDGKNPLFQQFAVDGVSEIQAIVGVKRGGAISGRILYPDGEPVIGAKVKIFRRDENFVGRLPYGYDSDDLTAGVTDDRGVYRISSLPAGEYIVQVTEPSLHAGSDDPVSSYDLTQYGSSSELKTFYPEASEMKNAKPVEIALGQEQTEINITIPDRRLFGISGTVVAKNNKMPLKNIQVSFFKIETDGTFTYGYDPSRRMSTNEKGTWSFKDLPKGKYHVTVSQAESYTDGADKKIKEPKYAPLTKEIELTDKDAREIVFELPFEATISGTVSVEGGKTFPTFVHFWAYDEKTKVSANSSLNNYVMDESEPVKTKKEFTIDDLSEGSFYLRIVPDDEFSVKSVKLGNRDLLISPIDLKDGESLEGVQVVLSTDVGIVKGKIDNFKSSEPAYVVLIPVGKTANEAFRSARQGLANRRGEFQIKIAPGEYYVIAASVREAPDLERETLDDWFKKMIRDAKKVTVKVKETTEISVTMREKEQ